MNGRCNLAVHEESEHHGTVVADSMLYDGSLSAGQPSAPLVLQVAPELGQFGSGILDHNMLAGLGISTGKIEFTLWSSIVEKGAVTLSTISWTVW